MVDTKLATIDDETDNKTLGRLGKSKQILLKHFRKSLGISYKEYSILTAFTNGVIAYYLSTLKKLNKIEADGKKE
jgi:hypothetical protein